jgi:uncharacterized membrane protein YphA (DoxX/SURF4 family)
LSSVLAGWLGGAALLVLVAGAGKVLDPSRTAGALRAVGWPSAAWLVRLGATAEVVLGAATLVVGGPVLAALVAASFLGFAWFVMTALQAGTPLATCGCVGQADTPPSPRHVVVDATLAVGALGAAVADAPALVEASWPTYPVAAAVAAAAYVAIRFR